MRSWADKDGNKRTTPEITLTDCGRSLKFPSGGKSKPDKPSRPSGEYESPPF
jgi:single-stranded DNA-binding protein